jgi:DNA-binding NtrC family response regulator
MGTRKDRIMRPAHKQDNRTDGSRTKEFDLHRDRSPEQPNVLIATIDPEIHVGLTKLFQSFSLNTIWLRGVESAKSELARAKIAACFCGFWLQDGTYRELVRHIRRERLNIPVIIVSAPACPDEYHDYLSAINLGALDFLSHPYEKRELERMLRLAIGPLAESIGERAMIGSDLSAQQTA